MELRRAWSMRIPNCLRPEPVLPLYVTFVTDASVASDFVLMRSAWSLFVTVLPDMMTPETVASLEIEP